VPVAVSPAADEGARLTRAPLEIEIAAWLCA
jgi:hypothetical protein